ncbi:MAG: Na+/H+ antiporter subunit E [Cyanobacteria bacterium J06623_7]
MDANTILNLILRLTIWLLLTADFGLPNLLIGMVIALLLPRTKSFPGSVRDWLQEVWQVLKAIPQAYAEAIEIMFRPHNAEDIIRQKVKPKRPTALVFLDIFLITFTPKTIVTRYDERGWYEIHRIKRKPRTLKGR